MFFANQSVTRFIPDEFWLDSLEPQLEEQLDTFVKFRDQIDRSKFLSDFVKSCVSFGIRRIDSPLFKAKVEHVTMSMVKSLDAQTTENLIFFLQNSGQIRNGPLVQRIMKHIEEKEWVLDGHIHDIMILVNLLNEHRTLFQPESLWDQIESTAVLQCFGDESKTQVPTRTLQEIINLYAFEFSRSHNEFTNFYGKYFEYMNANKEILAESLSLVGIANASIAFASFGMTTSDDTEKWALIRKGATTQLLQDKTPMETTQPLDMILGALTVVDSIVEGEKQDQERRQLNSAMVCAILERQQEILAMPLSTSSMLFACLSRFIAMVEAGQDMPTEASNRFDLYKENFAGTLAISHELKIDDVFVMATPLAAEQIQSPQMW